MKKRSLKILLLTIASMMFVSTSALVASKLIKPTEVVEVHADDSSSEPEQTEETFECSVVIAPVEHGSIKTDIKEGHIGDIVTITAKSDLLYLCESVSVNDVNLVESETTKGEYTFALVEGVNTIKSSFVVDQETLGVFAQMYDEARNKDWTNLFSMENVLVIVKWVLDGSILVTMVAYFIRDKKLSMKVEKTTKDTLNKIIPQSTKDTVVAAVEATVAPIVADLQSHMIEITSAMNVLTKVAALMQEDTPEAKVAVLEALSTIKIADMSSIQDVKIYIERLVRDQQKAYEEVMAKIADIKNQNIPAPVEEVKEEPKVEEPEVIVPHDDGTQI